MITTDDSPNIIPTRKPSKSIEIKQVAMYLCTFVNVTVISDDKPDLPSLLDRIVHGRYANHWDKLGLKLGLADYHINTISDNNKYNPNRVEDCCTAMLKQWLKEVASPTWGKLNDAIKEIEAPNFIPGTGTYIIFTLTNMSYICTYFEKQVDV